MLRKPALSRRMLFGIFTVSGFSGLIYESIWSHYLKLFLGHAAYAQTLVLAIFMGGMALGAWLVARNTAKIKNLLVGYALVELITGVLALLFHRVYVGSLEFAFDTAIPALGGAGSIAAFKWTLAALLILPQSILLGTTFPLISSGVIRRFPERSGETLAMLYFTNSLGAALGVLASGFWLISAVGLPGTVMTAGILNVLLALFVWVLARDQDVPAVKQTEPEGTSRIARYILAAAFLAGLAAFVYEIAWIRMLSLVLGSSTHAFELMLSAFILGLALGGFWVRRRIQTFASALRALAIMFAIMAVLGVATLPAYGFMFEVMSATINTFTPTETGYGGFNLVSHLIAAVMMIPTTVVAGMTLPLMTHFLMGQGAGEAAIGKVYAANTIGAIAGVLIAIHLLLPFVGTRGAVVLAALVQLGIAMLLFSREQTTLRTSFSMGALAASVLVVLVIATTVRLNPNQMASGVYRLGRSSTPPGAKVFYLRDGKTATITLTEFDDFITIATNGKPDAAINMDAGGHPSVDEITMIMAGALPLGMHPAPRRVANIGIGSGLTSQTVLGSPVVQVLDSVEIEPAIAEAARLGFGARVDKLFTDPRSRIHYEDAKTFFATQKEPYDVIISEPSNPWVSGVASLFSNEFYAQVTRYLAQDGLLVQWVQIYETDETVVASIVKALSPHFEDYQIYNTDNTNILIVAKVRGAVPPIRDSVFEGITGSELRHVGIEQLGQLELHRIGSKKTLDPMFVSMSAPANSDYFPFVDHTAPRMRFLRRNALALSQLNYSPIPLLELAGEPGPAASLARSSAPRFYAKEDLVQAALTIRDALVTGAVNELEPTVRLDMVMLAAPKEQCARPGMATAWLTSVQSITQKTSAYLAPGELAPVWQAIHSSACYAMLNTRDRVRVDFLESVAMRNRAAIVSHGKAMLADGDAVKDQERGYVILAVSAALLGNSDPQGVVRLLQEESQTVKQFSDRELGFRLLGAAALARANAAGQTGD